MYKEESFPRLANGRQGFMKTDQSQAGITTSLETLLENFRCQVSGIKEHETWKYPREFQLAIVPVYYL